MINLKLLFKNLNYLTKNDLSNKKINLKFLNTKLVGVLGRESSDNSQ